MSKIENRIKELGYTLPVAPDPVASYVPGVTSGNYVWTSGQLPLKEGTMVKTGRVGSKVSLEEAYDLAQLCALNALAVVKAQIGDLDKVKHVVKVVGFVSSEADFYDQPKVVNGASEIIGDIFGEAGIHARSAVGVTALPLDAPVEVEIVVEYE
ncbi:MAG: RidA family protein [Micrococcaceae bacterium]